MANEAVMVPTTVPEMPSSFIIVGSTGITSPIPKKAMKMFIRSKPNATLCDFMVKVSSFDVSMDVSMAVTMCQQHRYEEYLYE